MIRSRVRLALVGLGVGLGAWLQAAQVPLAAQAAPAAPAAPPTGMSVTVDGHVMRLFVSGDGGPAVVLEPGLANKHGAWTALQGQIAKFTRVISYDRPGLGESEACPRPRTARIIAEELTSALRAAKISPPYILVGWSLGATFARVFSGASPADVTGLVLIDPTPPQSFYERAAREQPELFKRYNAEDTRAGAAIPPGERGEFAAFDESIEQARLADPAITAPITVITSARTDLAAIGPIWLDEQKKWAGAMPRAKVVMVDSGNRAIPLAHPEVVLEAIRQLIRGR